MKVTFIVNYMPLNAEVNPDTPMYIGCETENIEEAWESYQSYQGDNDVVLNMVVEMEDGFLRYKTLLPFDAEMPAGGAS
jgi:hypothetical protein